jgi:hypothetical protein
MQERSEEQFSGERTSKPYHQSTVPYSQMREPRKASLESRNIRFLYNYSFADGDLHPRCPASIFEMDPIAIWIDIVFAKRIMACSLGPFPQHSKFL